MAIGVAAAVLLLAGGAVAAEQRDRPDVSATERLPLGAPGWPSGGGPGGGAASDGGGFSTLRTIGALGLVAGLVFAFRAIVRRWNARGGGLLAPSPSGVVSVLGRFPVSRGITLLLLKVDRRVLVVSQEVGRGGASLSLLSEITDAEEVASLLLKTRDREGASLESRFRSALAQAGDRHAPAGAEAEAVGRRTASRAPAVAPAARAADGAAERLRARLAAMRGARVGDGRGIAA